MTHAPGQEQVERNRDRDLGILRPRLVVSQLGTPRVCRKHPSVKPLSQG